MTEPPGMVPPNPHRRAVMAGAVAWAWAALGTAARAQGDPIAPHRRWYEAAEEMRRRAGSWGDQPYGAVLVLDGSLIGEGPSRVVQRSDPDAHAEREAIRHARERLGRLDLSGAILYATSRLSRVAEFSPPVVVQISPPGWDELSS